MFRLSWIDIESRFVRLDETSSLPRRAFSFRVLLSLVLIIQIIAVNDLHASSLQWREDQGQYSVDITAEPARVYPGGATTVTVIMNTNLDQARETLQVYLPNELEVLGSLSCTGSCTRAGLGTFESNDITAVMDVSGLDPQASGFGTLTFAVAVSQDARAGTNLIVQAYLGSPAAVDWVEIVVDEPPTPVPSTIALHVSPDGMVLEPGGSFRAFVFPHIPFVQGIDQQHIDNMPALTLTAALPTGLTLRPGSECFILGASIPSPKPLCEISEAGRSSGQRVLLVEIPESKESVGIFLMLGNEGLSQGVAHSVTFSLSLEEASGSITVTDSLMTIDVWTIDSLSSVGADMSEGSVNVLIMSEQMGCDIAAVQSNTDVALAEWGGGPILASSAIRHPDDLEGLETLENHCPTMATFLDVEERSLYILGHAPASGMDDSFCRACVLGNVPWVSQGMPIVTVDHIN